MGINPPRAILVFLRREYRKQRFEINFEIYILRDLRLNFEKCFEDDTFYVLEIELVIKSVLN